MNKKILMVSVLAVFMLVAISFATAINTTPAKKKESPLFQIRTRLAIGERLQDLKDTLKARFVGERLFFLPFNWLKNNIQGQTLDSIVVPTNCQSSCTYEKTDTCYNCQTSRPTLCYHTCAYNCPSKN
jgi:hypothetical protein